MRARTLATLVLAAAVGLPGGAPALAQVSGASGPDPAAAPAKPADLFEGAGITRSEKTLQAPDFALPDLAGKTVRLGDLAGRLVVVNFWATWCRPCVHEMPTLDRLAKRLGPEGLSVLAVSMDMGPPKLVAEFVQGYGWTMPVLLDTLSDVGDRFAVRVVPTTYLIGPDGTILGRSFGPREWDSPASVALMESLLHPSASD
jgi:thiol-disulfide isomerase/thioredoxin